MATQKTTLKTLKSFGLSLPGTTPKSPWPGHDDVAVNDKTFAYLSNRSDGGLSLSVKLPVSCKEALKLPNASPTGYGLGKSGWVSFAFPADATVPLDTARRWMMESYRAQAPKRLMKELEARQPWVKAGGLPDPRREDLQ
jgi:predicted DNA-binding protein (MmcQ/YjbR family)